MSSGKKRPNNDLLQRLPREKTGHRFLKHDVFLSHNQNDGSHLLCEALTDLGADAWHDGYADMAQRNVRSLVWGALTNSRYICVCVPDGFRDSEWVKVEYSSGLQIERRFGIPRVIVALTGPAAKAPSELSEHPTFDVHSEGVQRLAEFVLSENSTRTDSDHVRARGKALRGVINQHTNISLTALERARLGRLRIQHLLNSEPEVEAYSDLRYQLSDLRDACTGRAGFPPIVSDNEEMMSIFADIFDALSKRPAHVRSLDAVAGFDWWSGYSSHGMLEILGCIIANPTHRERAAHSFEVLCAILEATDPASPYRRKQVANWQRFARAVRGGEDFMTAVRRTTTDHHKIFTSRPWWKLW